MNKYMDDTVLNLTASILRLFRWLIIAFAVIAGFATAALGVAAMLPGAELIKPGDEYVAFVMPAAAVMLALSAWFIKLLRDLIVSVGHGQPLTAVNAMRLRTMGWLTLSLQIVILVTAIATGWLGHTDMFDFDTIYDFIEALIMSAVLFILARVFDHGARMHEELEGTV